jgi:hypothetical protein
MKKIFDTNNNCVILYKKVKAYTKGKLQLNPIYLVSHFYTKPDYDRMGRNV